MSHIKHEVTYKAGVINKVIKFECKEKEKTINKSSEPVAFLTKRSTVKNDYLWDPRFTGSHCSKLLEINT